MSDLNLGFEMRRIQIALSDILPVRQFKQPRDVSRYGAIRDSIKEVGLIEPLMVYPQKGDRGKYLLLDGHLRLFALKDLGRTEAECLVSKDDEGFTYNARVSRLNAIAEHKMIMKAINSGVKPERIAAALRMKLEDVRTSMTLLDGIHAEATDLLKDKGISPLAIRLLRKVTGIRQIEIAELLVSTNNFTIGYVCALVLGTPKDQLVKRFATKIKKGLSREEIARMEEEMESLERDLKAVDQAYGVNMLNLTLARSYIRKLLNNAKVFGFLNNNHPEILSEFQSIAAIESL